jgi:CubicO group peptidase (beta-lactamase class C family)
VDAAVTKLMAMDDIPGVAIALVRNGAVEYLKGYGVRDAAGDPVTETTVFGIGSLSKSFTALDVAQLVDAGKIDLDSPVATYLPDFKLADPQATKTLTVRQVLSQASGLPRSDAIWAYGSPADRKAIIADMATIALTAKPGAAWQYSNQNYVLAGSLVERLTGLTWEEYTRRNVLAPLGMTKEDFSVQDMQKTADFSQAFQFDVRHGTQTVDFSERVFRNLALIGPAGSMNATIADMASYALFQLGDGTANGRCVVSRRMLDEMHRRHIGLAGMTEGTLETQLSATGNMGYALGWFTEDYRGHQLVQHPGIISGFYSTMTLDPADHLGVVILTNSAGGQLAVDPLRLRLMEMLLGLASDQDLAALYDTRYGVDPDQYHADALAARAFAPDPESFKPLVGDLEGPGGKVTILTHDGKLFVGLVAPAPREIELVPMAADRYLLNSSFGTVISFTVDGKGTVSAYQGAVMIGQRLGKGVTLAKYSDPRGRFSATLPDGFAARLQDDVETLVSTSPSGSFYLSAAEASSDELGASVAKKLKQIDASFQQDPIRTNAVAHPNGQTWTQFLYALPDGDLVAALATRQKDTVYFVILRAPASSVQALTGAFQQLWLSVVIP